MKQTADRFREAIQALPAPLGSLADPQHRRGDEFTTALECEPIARSGGPSIVLFFVRDQLTTWDTYSTDRNITGLQIPKRQYKKLHSMYT